MSPAGGTVTVTITPGNVIAPAGQGIAAGEFDEFNAAVRAATTYLNVHAAQSRGDELRGQVEEHY